MAHSNWAEWIYVAVVIALLVYVGIAASTIMEDDKNDHAKRGTLPSDKSGCLHFRIVTTKLTELSIDETPNTLSPKIHISAAGAGALITE